LVANFSTVIVEGERESVTRSFFSFSFFPFRVGENKSGICDDKPIGRLVVMARERKRRQAQWQARQAKSKKQNRYVIKVMRLNTQGDAVPFVRENQRMHRAF
jgi:hypothetical protein